jgi:chaperonin cofactor prefoldin
MDWHLIVEILALAIVVVGNAIVVHNSISSLSTGLDSIDKRLERLEKKDDKATERALDGAAKIQKKRRQGEVEEPA